MRIGFYLRLSLADGDICDKKESNSIENQRLLLQDYIDSQDELVGEIVEYVDDGYTGTDFDRPGFKKMLADARKGNINVLLVKDLSRLGRNYIELGDYLDQIFPRIGLRVIAINSDYDSKDHEGDVSGLDVAITNFINAMYSRDMSMKIKSGYRSRWARGIAAHKQIPYGYRHDEKQKGKWLIDREAAKVVHDIFEWAANGWRVIEIVDRLNELHVETPGEYLERVFNIKHPGQVTDKERLWDYNRVHCIIRSEEYIGVHYVHKKETCPFDFKKSKSVPKEEWICLKDHHPPIVSKVMFDQAQNCFGRAKWSDKHEPAIFALKSRIRCGNCHMMFKNSQDIKRLYCDHKRKAGKYSKCSEDIYDYKMIETKVFAALKVYLRDMKALEFVIKGNVGNHKEKAIKSAGYHEGKIEVLKAERVRQYEGYSSGLITADAYLKKKEELSAAIEEHQESLKKMKDEIREDYEVLTLVHESREAADCIEKEYELTRKMVETFIKTVYIYDINRIEIVFTTEDIISKVIRRNNQVFEDSGFTLREKDIRIKRIRNWRKHET